MQELEGKECRSILTTKVVERFEEIKEKAETCSNVATLQNIKVEADALKVRFLNEIAVEEAKILAGKQPPSPRITITNGEEERVPVPVSLPKTKTQKTISIKSINAETTWRIETEQDVDRYVEGLKRKLKESVNEDVILNIEF